IDGPLGTALIFVRKTKTLMHYLVADVAGLLELIALSLSDGGFGQLAPLPQTPWEVAFGVLELVRCSRGVVARFKLDEERPLNDRFDRGYGSAHSARVITTLH